MTATRSVLKVSVLVLLTLGAGYVGGALHGWMDQAQPLATVCAKRFELVDGSGRTLAVLASNSASPGGGDAGATLSLTDPRGVPRCELGMNRGNSTPFLRLYGRDGAERVALVLGYQDDPVLTLGDGRKTRAVLGARHGDMPGPAEDRWSLSLYARKDGADANIGFYRWADNTYHAAVTLRDGTGRKWEAAAGEPLKPIPMTKVP